MEVVLQRSTPAFNRKRRQEPGLALQALHSCTLLDRTAPNCPVDSELATPGALADGPSPVPPFSQQGPQAAAQPPMRPAPSPQKPGALSPARGLPPRSPGLPALRAGRWRILVGLAAVSAVFIASSWLPLHVVVGTWSSTSAVEAVAAARRRLGQAAGDGASAGSLTGAGAAVHGRVAKAGPLDPLLWHANYTADRRRAFAGWLKGKGLADPAVPAKEVEAAAPPAGGARRGCRVALKTM